MTKRYFTKDKNGVDVEVSQELAKELVNSGKKKISDFSIEGSDDTKETQYNVPSNDLSTLKARAQVLGYSGLSKDDQSKLEYSYAKSEAKKTKTFEQVAAEMDANAKQYRDSIKNIPTTDDNVEATPIVTLPIGTGDKTVSVTTDINNPLKAAQNVWQLVREGLSMPVAAAVGGVKHGVDAIRSTPTNESYLDKFITEQQAGEDAKGLSGFLSSPLNVLGGVPGRLLGGVGSTLAGVGKGLGLTSKSIPLVKGAIQYLSKGTPAILSSIAKGAGEGAGLSVLNDKMEGNDIDLISLGIGSVLGGAGGALTSYAPKMLPGMITGQRNPNIDERTQQLAQSIAHEMLEKGIFPIRTKEGFYNLISKEKDKLSKAYAKAIDAVDRPKGCTIKSVQEELQKFKIEHPNVLTLNDMARLSQLPDRGFPLPKNITAEDLKILPFMRVLEDIKLKMESEYGKKLARRYAEDDPALKLLARDFKAVERSHLRNQPERPSVMTAEELSNVRTAKTNPQTYKDPDALLSLAKKDLGGTWRDVINKELERDPRYSKFINEELKNRYAKLSAFEDVMDSPEELIWMLQ